MPAADVEVTTELVRRLLAGQHQDLAGRPVEFLANGWDNAMFRLGDDLLVRLPRREAAAQILLNEQRWLPVLAPRIQLPIPYPERTGLPAHGYPFSWSVVPYLPGRPCRRRGLARPGGRGGLGRRLPRLAARPRAAGRPRQSLPRRTAGRPRRRARGQPPAAVGCGRPGGSAARVGGGDRRPRLRRPAPLAPRRPAPRQHPGQRWPGQRRNRLRRHHRGRSRHRPGRRLDAAAA